MATILTHNAPSALLDCLHAVETQTRPPDAVLVVDNASTTAASDVVEGGPLVASRVRVVREELNGGPAGGHAVALREFLASDHDLAWVMDDDCVPDSDCLEELLTAGLDRRGPTYVFPRWIQPDGKVTYHPAWCGFLIDKAIVRQVGFPMVELFWWAEDTEYLMWRIPRAGYPIVHAELATVHHTQVRAGNGNPPWKYYYESRNNVFYHLYVKRNLRRLPKKLTMMLARLVVRERERRGAKFVMVLRGLRDGFGRRLGRRVSV